MLSRTRTGVAGLTDRRGSAVVENLMLALLGCVPLALGIWLVRERRATKRLTRAHALLLAEHDRRRAAFASLVAASMDEHQLRALLTSAVSVDMTDDQGDTALHVAYLNGNQVAVDNLIAAGADPGVKNDCGLLPRDMAAVRRAMKLLDDLAYGLEDSRQRDRKCTVLLGLPPASYMEGVRRFLTSDAHAYTAVVRVGYEGSENALAEHLMARGSKGAAAALLNSGHPLLRGTAVSWAARNGYSIYESTGFGVVTWGSH
jgi:ankyrin repeat protein